MKSNSHHQGSLSTDQVRDLLGLTASTGSHARFHALVCMPSSELLRLTQEELTAAGLGPSDVRRLAGLSRSAFKSWLSDLPDLSEKVHHKLAAICLLLDLARHDEENPGPSSLARAALRRFKGSEASAIEDETVEDTAEVIGSVFGTKGLLAAALFSILEPSA